MMQDEKILLELARLILRLTCKSRGNKTFSLLNPRWPVSNSFYHWIPLFTFCRSKSNKNARHTGRSSRSCLCSWIALKQYNSFDTRLSLQAFLPFAGCCVTRSVRLYKINYTRTALRQYSHNGLPPAGLSAVSLTVPVAFSGLLLLYCTPQR